MNERLKIYGYGSRIGTQALSYLSIKRGFEGLRNLHSKLWCITGGRFRKHSVFRINYLRSFMVAIHPLVGIKIVEHLLNFSFVLPYKTWAVLNI